MAQVLLVEDDAAIRTALTRSLRDQGHVVSAVGSGIPALSAAVEQKPDVVLLDLGLPDIDGLALISMVRAVADLPIIVITARDDRASIVRALDAGADDYVVKPFGADEVDARIRAVLRRTAVGAEPGPIRVGGLEIDERSRVATLDGVRLDLARKEFDLLLALAQRPGEVVTKRELLAGVWREPYGGSERRVDVHLSWLRRKLGETAQEPRYLHSLRGVGVRLVDPDD
jgi:DNA-binding response OmpR family regulator